MSVIDKIHMLKKMVKEADRIVTWQSDIYTALHNIDADWVVSGVFDLIHIPNMDWAHISGLFPRTIAELLSDHNLAHHGLGTIVPHDALANLAEKAHSSLTGIGTSDHHTKTTLFTGLTDRWTLAQAHRGANDKIMVFKGPDADPVEEDKAGIPSGLIVMWHGLITNIPAGWVICDGNNGTPNLLGRFVEGVATALTNPGATGGATSKTTSGHKHSNPHTGTEPAHSHGNPSTSSAPTHTHANPDTGLAGGTAEVRYEAGPSITYAGDHTHTQAATYGGGGHSHTQGSTYSAGGHSHTQGDTGSKTDSISDIRPLYYDIAFIMKT